MQISAASFEEDVQTRARQALANAAGVSLSKVRIASWESLQARRRQRRRLLAEGVKVEMEVATPSTTDAARVANLLTAENINRQLTQAGLPPAEILEPANFGGGETTGEPAWNARDSLILSVVLPLLYVGFLAIATRHIVRVYLPFPCFRMRLCCQAKPGGRRPLHFLPVHVQIYLRRYELTRTLDCMTKISFRLVV